MFELLVVMTYLARAWSLMSRIEAARVSMPVPILDDLLELLEELQAFILDPTACYALAGAAPAPVTSETSSISSEPAVKPVEVPVVVVEPEPCPDCQGTGKRGSRFIGYKPSVCATCDGAGTQAEEEAQARP